MSKRDNLKDYLIDLYEGIASKKADASRNPQDFRNEIEAIETGEILPEWDGLYTQSDDTEIISGDTIVEISGFPIETDTLNNDLLTEDNKDKVYKCDDKLYQVDKAESLKGLTIKFNPKITTPCPIGETDRINCWGIFYERSGTAITNTDKVNVSQIKRKVFLDYGGDGTTYPIVINAYGFDEYEGEKYPAYFADFAYDPELETWWCFDENGNANYFMSNTLAITNFDCPELNENPAFIEWVFANAKVYSKIEVVNDIRAFKLNVKSFDENAYMFGFQAFISAMYSAIQEVTGDYNFDLDVNGRYVVSFTINGEVFTKEFPYLTLTLPSDEVRFHNDDGDSLHFSTDWDNFDVIIKYNDAVLEDEPTFTKFDCMLNDSYWFMSYIMTYGELLGMEYINGYYFAELLKEDEIDDSAAAMLDAILDGSIINLRSTATSVMDNAMQGRLMLESVDLPNAEALGYMAFANCVELSTVNLPRCKAIGSECFAYCTNLREIDLPVVEFIGDYCFNESGLESLTIRSPQVCEAWSDMIFETPIEYGNGYIYVPAELVDSYKSATNWSYYADQIRAIEE